MKFDSKTFNPVAFGMYIDRIPALKRNELIKSKALKPNAEIKAAFSTQSGAMYARIPMFDSLSGEPVNYDGNTDIISLTTKTYERGVVVVGRANAWTEKDFSEDITGGVDFMSNVAMQIAEYWQDIDQSTLLSVLKGIFSMTGVQNLKFVENHTLDISDKDDGYIEPITLNRAVQKACGDNKNKFTVAIMHSEVATMLENLNMLKFLQYTDSDGIQRDLTLAQWNGKAVLIDDSMPVEEVNKDEENYTKYTTYILGDGAIDYEDIGAKVPFEMNRDPKTNGGQDTLYSRQRKVFAPYGISYEKVNQATLSPTNEELEDGNNWTIVRDGEGETINHKAIAIARIISRG